MPTIRQLRHLTALVEESSYTRAAERVHLTQPALTRSIQALEETLGVRLLDRTPSGVSLTQSGQSLYHRAERVLTELDALKRDATLLRGHDTGTVRFGVGVYPAAAFLLPLLQRLAADYPGICAHVEIESWRRLLEKLDSGTLDFVVAITHSLPPSSSYATRHLPDQVAGLFVRAEHPLLLTPQGKLQSELMKYGLAATDLPPRARQHLALAYGLSSIEQLPISLECDNVDALRDVVLTSDTVLFSTRDAIRAAVESRRLFQLPIEYFEGAELTCSIIHQAHLTLSSPVETVIGLIQEIMQPDQSEPA